MQAVISPASAVESSARVCASQIRNSTVPNAWCGRTLHQSCVCSTIEFTRDEEVDEVGVAGPVPNGSWTPQRGKLFVKICVRAECRPESRPSRNGEFAEIASRSGSSARRWSHTAIARSAPRTPTCTCSENVLLRHATYLSPSSRRR